MKPSSLTVREERRLQIFAMSALTVTVFAILWMNGSGKLAAFCATYGIACLIMVIRKAK